MNTQIRYFVLALFFVLAAVGAATRLYGRAGAGLPEILILFAAGFGAGAAFARGMAARVMRAG
jgi:hypothetical protein